jgi:hypothetical protein
VRLHAISQTACVCVPAARPTVAACTVNVALRQPKAYEPLNLNGCLRIATILSLNLFEHSKSVGYSIFQDKTFLFLMSTRDHALYLRQFQVDPLLQHPNATANVSERRDVTIFRAGAMSQDAQGPINVIITAAVGPVLSYRPSTAFEQGPQAHCLARFLVNPDSSARVLWRFLPASHACSVGFFYVPWIYDMGPTSLLPLRRQGVLWVFIAFRNPSFLTGFEPLNLGSSGQRATNMPPRVTYICTYTN